MASDVKKTQWEGAHPVALLISFAVGIGIWLTPHPEPMDPRAWQLFAIFVSTIVAIIAKALPMGAVALTAIGLCAATHTLTIQQSLSGFSNPVIWLIVFAFFIARGFVKTGLGTRIAYLFVALLGKKTLGLAYGMALTEVLLAPAIPSNTARAGGIIYPIIKALSLGYDSDPEKGTQKRIGAFLIQSAYQCNLITSAMFLTAMAANPLILSILSGMGVEISWGTWALAASLPGVISLVLIPYLIFKIYPPEIKETPDAPEIAAKKLREMGSLTRNEGLMIAVFALLLGLWIFGQGLFGMASTTAAIVGLSVLLMTGVLTWQDIKGEHGAWDTLIWFSALVMMASFLNELGFISWCTDAVKEVIADLPWTQSFPLLLGIYFYSHYFFASNTAHVSSMFAAFFGIGLAVGAPPMLLALSLAFSSSLFSSLTHYGTGSAPVLFGSKYVDLVSWWRVGSIVSVVNILVWMGIGSLWWKALGLW